AVKFFWLGLEPLDLPAGPLGRRLTRGLALERLPCGILASLRDRLAGLGVQLDDVLLERLGLELEPLLRRDHVGDAALHVLEELELLLVRVIELLRRLLRAVEQLRPLRLNDVRRPLNQPGHRPSSSFPWLAYRR